MRFRDGEFRFEKFCSAEGDDGGEGGGGEQSSGETDGEVSAIPSGLPEKFWDASTQTVRQDELIGAYNNISSSYTKKQEDIRAEMDSARLANRPADVDGYKFEIPASVQIPDGYEFTLNEADPMLAFWKQHSFDNGFGQEQFDEGIAQYVNAQIGQLPDRAAEIQKLGERGDERYERAATWMTKDMPTELHGPLAEMLKTADGVVAVEKLMERNNVPFNNSSIHTQGDPADDPSNTAAYEAKTKAMMAEEGPGSYTSGDAGAVQAVRDRWSRSAPGSTGPQMNRSGR